MQMPPDAERTPLRFPDFLGIGAQKAGTTWLHRKLDEHPDIWVPPLKEIHYFDVHLERTRDPATGLTAMDVARIEKSMQTIEGMLKGGRSIRDRMKRIQGTALIGMRTLTDEWYGTIFQDAARHQACGEITPEYALLPDEGIAHITRLCPDIKIIFVLRDPVDRGWSSLRMMQRRTNTVGSHELRQVASEDFLFRADYSVTIERYRRHVPTERILLLDFDEIATNPMAFLTKVCDFLGVPVEHGQFKKLETPIHQGQQSELDPLLYQAICARLRPAYERLLALGFPAARRWYDKHYANDQPTAGGVAA